MIWSESVQGRLRSLFHEVLAFLFGYQPRGFFKLMLLCFYDAFTIRCSGADILDTRDYVFLEAVRAPTEATMERSHSGTLTFCFRQFSHLHCCMLEPNNKCCSEMMMM